jgi:hypothetical protein
MPKAVDTVDIGEITSPRIHRLYSYWESRCRARGVSMPRRGDVDPDQVRDLLPNMMIVEVEREPLRFRYRLVGTRVVEYNGLEFTGRYLGEIGWPEEQDLFDGYVRVIEGRRPIFGSLAWGLTTGRVGRCEFTRLPLSEDDTVVSQILAMEDYDFPQLDAMPTGLDPTR